MVRTGRPRGFDRNEALHQAMHQFWADGYESSSLAQLKACMGDISAPSFYAAFGSKEQLFAEVVALYIATHGQVMDSLFDAALAPRAALEQALRASARMQTGNGHPSGCLLVLSTSLCPPRSPALRQQLLDDRARTGGALLGCVQRAVDSGALLASVDTQVLAATFDTFLQGMTAMARQGVPLATLDAAISQLLVVWDVHAGVRVENVDGA